MGNLVKHAKEMQEKLKKAQQEIVRLEVTGQSGGGMVKITINGESDTKSVYLDPELLTEDKKMIEDLIAAAFNDAVQKIEKEKKSKMEELTGQSGFPAGMKMPFLFA